MTTAYSRRGVHGRVVDDLGQRIVGGDIAPGRTIDPEYLEREFDVSRTVVRETLRVLSTKGLVDARPHRGTFVRPRLEWNLLDEDIIAWRSAREPDMRLLQELEEVRQIIEPAGTRLAAERATDTERATIEAALTTMRRCAASDDVAGQVEADLAFHQAILKASGNELLDRLEQLLGPALRVRDVIAITHLRRDDFLEAHERVFRAIKGGKAAQAASGMTKLLHGAAADMAAILRGGLSASAAP